MRKFYWRLAIVIASFGSVTAAWAQQSRICATTEYLKYQTEKDPALAQKLLQLEQMYKQHLSANQKSQRSAVITIPVVVHIVHDGDIVGNSENLSDAQILSQIEVLNKDFRRLNADASNTPSAFTSVAADFEIEFCMAQRDPNGNSTDGINRINGGRSSWTMNTVETFKPTAIWDPDKYLNIWVLRLAGTSASTLGYAQFPGLDPTTDGIVIDYVAFGTIGNLATGYRGGRTTTHEVGHWLGLRHIWGDGDCSVDDWVSDTPLQEEENFGCPTFPHISCNNGPNGDMFMNYMDYTNDDCSNLFTSGQKFFADLTFALARTSIKNSNGCVPVPVLLYDLAVIKVIYPTDEMCTNGFVPIISIGNFGSETITSFTINYKIDGGSLTQIPWQGNLESEEVIDITLPALTLLLGAHNLEIYLSNPNGNTDQNIQNDDVIKSFNVNSLGVGNSIPASEDFESGSFVPQYWALQNPDGGRAWTSTSDAGGFGMSSTSASFDNYSIGSNHSFGARDALITPKYDFRYANNPYVTFDVAYARRSAGSNDSLLLYASVNCGDTWERLWSKGGEELSTAADQLTKFIPADTAWRKEQVYVGQYTGYYKMQFKIENYSDRGNMVYIDNFNIEFLQVIGISNQEAEAQHLKIYPNPTKGQLWISLAENMRGTIEIFNSLGKRVYVDDRIFTAKESVDLPADAPGLYVIKIKTKNWQISEKVVLSMSALN